LWKKELTNILGIQYPILQAPMAGGITTSELVSAVSDNGGLGMVGAGYMTPSQLQNQIKDIKKRTQRKFAVNLFVPNEFYCTEKEMLDGYKLLEPYRSLFSLETYNPEVMPGEKARKMFHDQINVLIEERVSIVSFTFGLPPKEILTLLKEQGITIIGTATTVQEAVFNEKMGVDAIVAQGSEAGGHRGSFQENEDSGMIGLMSLIPQIADSVTIPVIAAGGIMDGRGIAASVCLGAEGVQMGTAFLTCHESGAHPIHKEAILNSSEENTTMTKAFSGKWARGINNKFIKDFQDKQHFLPPFPVQNTLTKEIRSASKARNNPEYMSLWSGQSPQLAKKLSVPELMEELIRESEKLLNK
jgi:nitronate monooxygenase